MMTVAITAVDRGPVLPSRLILANDNCWQPAQAAVSLLHRDDPAAACAVAGVAADEVAAGPAASAHHGGWT